MGDKANSKLCILALSLSAGCHQDCCVRNTVPACCTGDASRLQAALQIAVLFEEDCKEQALRRYFQHHYLITLM
jgi:hypothetical protein